VERFFLLGSVWIGPEAIGRSTANLRAFMGASFPENPERDCDRDGSSANGASPMSRAPKKFDCAKFKPCGF